MRSINSGLAVAQQGRGIAVFHQGYGGNGQLWCSYFDGANWHPDFQVLGRDANGNPTLFVGISGSPSAVVWNGQLFVFHQGHALDGNLPGGDGRLWYTCWNGTNWTTGQVIGSANGIYLPVLMSESPSAVVGPNGGIYVFHHGGR